MATSANHPQHVVFRHIDVLQMGCVCTKNYRRKIARHAGLLRVHCITLARRITSGPTVRIKIKTKRKKTLQFLPASANLNFCRNNLFIAKVRRTRHPANLCGCPETFVDVHLRLNLRTHGWLEDQAPDISHCL